MINFKRLAFITVMVATALLAIGNLTTPAQANRADVATRKTSAMPPEPSFSSN